MKPRARPLSPLGTLVAKNFKTPHLPGGGQRLYYGIITDTCFCEEDGDDGGQ
jgi:hypothetical protein